MTDVIPTPTVALATAPLPAKKSRRTGRPTGRAPGCIGGERLIKRGKELRGSIGPGAVPELYRKRSRKFYGKLLEEFERRALPPLDITDLVSMANVTGKYGGLIAREITVDVVRAKLTQTLVLLRRELPEKVAEPLINRLREVWR